MNKNKWITLLISFLMCISFCGCDEFDRFMNGDRYDYYDDGYGYNDNYNSQVMELNSHYIDVGQGDCELIEFPDGQTMLIDAGPAESGDKIVKYIKRLGYDYIDYVVATHPHSDHIGGMKKVINSFGIGEIYMPRAETTTKTYEELLKAIRQKGEKIKTTTAGTEIYKGNDPYVKVETLAPNSSQYEELNNYSIVLKITYGKVRLLYMGDAEVLSEQEILNKYDDVSADVVKVGHHGSNTSSCQEFVRKVDPQYAIFSLGKDNDYHHPHSQIVQRWKNAGAEILRTDQYGTMILHTDGDQFDIDTEKE